MASISRRIDKNGKVSYRVQIRLKGFPEKNANFDSLELAQIWAKQVEDNLKFNRQFKEKLPVKFKFKEIINKYKNEHIHELSPSEQSKRISQLNFWVAYFGDKYISEITPLDIECVLDEVGKMVTTRYKKLYSPKTIHRKLAALSHVFTMCVVKWKILDRNPVQCVVKPQSKSIRMGNSGEVGGKDMIYWMKSYGVEDHIIAHVQKKIHEYIEKIAR